MLTRKGSLLGCVLVFPAGLALGGQAIPNWSAPATWSPSRAVGVHTLADITNPLPFIAVTPCRVADTRGNGFSGAYGPPSLAADANRTFVITGQCGIPASAAAVSFNFGALNVAGDGDLRVFPAGAALPLVSTMNYNANTPNIANAAIVPLGTGGGITVRGDAMAVDLIMDVNGYYASTSATNRLGSLKQFAVFGTFNGNGVILGENDDPAFLSSGVRGRYTGTGSGYGVVGVTTSTATGAAGIRGDGTSGKTYGVHGISNSSDALSAGVNGEANLATSNAGRFINPVAGVTTLLATQVAGVNYGIYAPGAKILGGSLDITGAPKNFAAPHPLDPSKEIKYASVEAPTVDVYFRGTGTLTNGFARIDVPDHFRLTARQGTYMTTLTPVGRAISLSVESEGPDGIVVRGSGSTKFHYVVYAERAEIEGFEPVQPNVNFTPEALEKGGMLKALPEPTRALLVRNGTLNPDGTYNLETARAMGWAVPETAADTTTAPR